MSIDDDWERHATREDMTDKDFALHTPLMVNMMKKSGDPDGVLSDFVTLSAEQRATVLRMYEVMKND